MHNFAPKNRVFFLNFESEKYVIFQKSLIDCNGLSGICAAMTLLTNYLQFEVPSSIPAVVLTCHE